MSEVTFLATVDESRTLRLPDDVLLGRVEVLIREKPILGNGAALLEAYRNLPPRTEEGAVFWREAGEEIVRDREAWDDNFRFRGRKSHSRCA